MFAVLAFTPSFGLQQNRTRGKFASEIFTTALRVDDNVLRYQNSRRELNKSNTVLEEGDLLMFKKFRVKKY
jgi:hypothetical protein